MGYDIKNSDYRPVFSFFFFFAGSDMLKMGKSKPWPEALEKLTGSKVPDVSAITEYFKP